jgi:hypothetical protein
MQMSSPRRGAVFHWVPYNELPIARSCGRQPVPTFQLGRWTAESVRDVDYSPDSVVEGDRN